MFLHDRDLARIDAIVAKYAHQIKDAIVTSAQNVIDTVTTELTNLQGPLGVVLTEVNALVAGQPVNTTALKEAADAVVASVNSVADAAGTPPVPVPPAPPVTPPPAAPPVNPSFR
jgi:hypothetical protein